MRSSTCLQNLPRCMYIMHGHAGSLQLLIEKEQLICGLSYAVGMIPGLCQNLAHFLRGCSLQVAVCLVHFWGEVPPSLLGSLVVAVDAESLHCSTNAVAKLRNTLLDHSISTCRRSSLWRVPCRWSNRARFLYQGPYTL